MILTQRFAAWCRALAGWLDPIRILPAGMDSPVQRLVSSPTDTKRDRVVLLSTRTAQLVRWADATWPEATGEFKRHQVFARLLKEYPQESRRKIGRTIEEALS